MINTGSVVGTLVDTGSGRYWFCESAIGYCLFQGTILGIGFVRVPK